MILRNEGAVPAPSCIIVSGVQRLVVYQAIFSLSPGSVNLFASWTYCYLLCYCNPFLVGLCDSFLKAEAQGSTHHFPTQTEHQPVWSVFLSSDYQRTQVKQQRGILVNSTCDKLQPKENRKQRLISRYIPSPFLPFMGYSGSPLVCVQSISRHLAWISGSVSLEETISVLLHIVLDLASILPCLTSLSLLLYQDIWIGQKATQVSHTIGKSCLVFLLHRERVKKWARARRAPDSQSVIGKSRQETLIELPYPIGGGSRGKSWSSCPTHEADCKRGNVSDILISEAQ